MEPGTTYISSTASISTEEDIKRFQCDEDESIMTIKRVRTADGEPVVYCVDQVPSSYLSADFLTMENPSIFQSLEQSGDIHVSYAVTYIDPIGYHNEVSPILNCKADQALLVLKQFHYDDNDRVVLYSRNYFRADKFSFHVVRKRV